MSDLFTLIAARITDACPAVAFARPATSAAEAESEVMGAAGVVLVVPAAERWRRVDEAGLHVHQSGDIGISCVLGLAFPAGFEAWSEIRAQLRAALMGWTPAHPEAAEPIQASGARLLAYSAEDGGRWLHSFDFILPAQDNYEHQS